MKKIALIDGKNVTTDWVEEMFDSFECINEVHRRIYLSLPATAMRS